MIDERFWSKVDFSGDCWEWTASVIGGNRGGYGQFRVGKKMRKSHVVAYEALVGPVPAGCELDHLCRNRACVNPDHLEPVTRAVNRSRSPLTSEKKTHCPAGHEYTEANTLRYSGRRHCRACKHESYLKRRSQSLGRTGREKVAA